MVISCSQHIAVSAGFCAVNSLALPVPSRLALAYLHPVRGGIGRGHRICPHLVRFAVNLVYAHDRRGKSLGGFWGLALSITVCIFHVGCAISRYKVLPVLAARARGGGAGGVGAAAGGTEAHQSGGGSKGGANATIALPVKPALSLQYA